MEVALLNVALLLIFGIVICAIRAWPMLLAMLAQRMPTRRKMLLIAAAPRSPFRVLFRRNRNLRIEHQKAPPQDQKAIAERRLKPARG